jgi:hypothetical protein
MDLDWIDNPKKSIEQHPGCQSLDFPYFLLSGIGCVVTTINPAYTTSEVARQLIMSKTKKILTLPKSVKLVEEAILTLKGAVRLIFLPKNLH